MRLQKYLALCGVASRRAAEEMIANGLVTVDGQTVTQMGAQVEDGQEVCVRGERVTPEERKVYIMYHKPAGEVTTSQDPEGRATVLDRFRDFPERLFPVGRLDYDSEGLLLLTNDGEIMQKLTHPSKKIDKTYLARVTGALPPDSLRALRDGVPIDGRLTSPAKVSVLKYEAFATALLITIHEGRNRQVRRMLESVGHKVLMLRRVRLGPLDLKGLERGQWRFLTQEEIDKLKAL